MAVRIALQCNEADSYLILNDENSAARLLSRPGEAIYNDMSGMVEGNNPFQVAWLPDEVRERFLHRVTDTAKRESVRIPVPMTVFEGNVPADIRNNTLLKERLARPFQADGKGGVCAWVGEANAIKGPTEVRFTNQGSSNLLIVGQQREAALSVISSILVSLAAAWFCGIEPPVIENPAGGSFRPTLMGPVKPSLRMTWTLTLAVPLARRARLDGTTNSAKSGCGWLSRRR
jgi:hypothetical protein